MHIEFVQFSLLTIIGGVFGYQLLLSFLAFKNKSNSDFTVQIDRKFAVLVLVQEHQEGLSRSLYSLSGLIYPKNKCDLFVIANDHTTKVALLAERMGATVLKYQPKETTDEWGPIRWAFNRIINSDPNYDAVVVFEADSLVSGNFLEVMNFYLDQGSAVVQGSNLLLPDPGSPPREMARIKQLFNNYVKPLGRKRLGINTAVIGNGICIQTDILRQIPWRLGETTSCKEYGLLLQLNGITIDYAPEAKVFAANVVEDNCSKTTSWQQEGHSGNITILRKHFFTLFIAAFKQRRFAFLDILIELITPSFAKLMFIIGGAGLGTLILWMVGLVPLSFFWSWIVLAIIGVSYVAMGLAAAGARGDLYNIVRYLPAYLIQKAKCYFINFRRTGGQKKSIDPSTEQEEPVIVENK
jgi:cellulose synthase/poly-beta-1,6-N-acetylglucosamine synthase-like glycosyltransferase